MKPVALTMILARHVSTHASHIGQHLHLAENSWVVANIRESSQDAAIAEGLR